MGRVLGMKGEGVRVRCVEGVSAGRQAGHQACLLTALVGRDRCGVARAMHTRAGVEGFDALWVCAGMWKLAYAASLCAHTSTLAP